MNTPLSEAVRTGVVNLPEGKKKKNTHNAPRAMADFRVSVVTGAKFELPTYFSDIGTLGVGSFGVVVYDVLFSGPDTLF